jgi:quinol monooxygenase YgiN
MTRTLYAEFTVRPGSEERVAEMMRELTEHVRRESGNTLFLPYTRETNPREYFVFEVYRTRTRSRSTSLRNMVQGSTPNWRNTSKRTARF